MKLMKSAYIPTMSNIVQANPQSLHSVPHLQAVMFACRGDALRRTLRKPCFYFSDQNALWSVIAEHFGVLKVAKKGRICSNGHRTPQVVLLKGDNPWVRHVDNGIK